MTMNAIPEGMRRVASRSLTPPLIVVLVALGLRVAWWRVGPHVIESEGAYYARVGENLATGHHLTDLHAMGTALLDPPLYATLIAAGVKSGLTSETAGRSVSLLAGSLLPLIVFLFARRLYGQSAA